MPAVFGAGSDLLAGLGGVARVAEIAGDADKLLAIAEAARRRGRGRSGSARTRRGPRSTRSPVEALEDEVANAEQALEDAVRPRHARATVGPQSGSRRAASSLVADAARRRRACSATRAGRCPSTGRITDGFGPRPNKPLARSQRVPPRHRYLRRPPARRPCSPRRRRHREAGRNGSLRQLGPHRPRLRSLHGLRAPRRRAAPSSSPGRPSRPGSSFGAVGITGASTGCHLHFEVRIDGTAVNAIPFMAARGIALG